MDYKTKYEILLSYVIMLAKPEDSQQEVEYSNDFINEFPQHNFNKEEVPFHDAIDHGDRLIAFDLRTYLKENLQLDITQFNSKNALELAKINPCDLDDKTKYEALLNYLINLAKPDVTLEDLAESYDFITDFPKANGNDEEVAFNDSLEHVDKLIAYDLRSFLLENIGLDISNLDPDTALELVKINPSIMDAVNCVPQDPNINKRIKMLEEKSKVLKKIRES